MSYTFIVNPQKVNFLEGPVSILMVRVPITLQLDHLWQYLLREYFILGGSLTRCTEGFSEQLLSILVVSESRRDIFKPGESGREQSLLDSLLVSGVISDNPFEIQKFKLNFPLDLFHEHVRRLNEVEQLAIVRRGVQELLKGSCVGLKLRLEKDTVVDSLGRITNETLVQAFAFGPPETQQSVRACFFIFLNSIFRLLIDCLIVKSQVSKGHGLSKIGLAVRFIENSLDLLGLSDLCFLFLQ